MSFRSPLALALVTAAACSDYSVGEKPDGPTDDVVDTDVTGGLCSFDLEPATVTTVDGCGDYTLGSFTPWVEWNGGKTKSSLALPVVADLDGDGLPEILVNLVGGAPLGFPNGQLAALHGDGSGELWRLANAKLAMGASPAVADLDGDGSPEVLAVRNLGSQNPLSPVAQSKYALVAWSSTGAEMWQSAIFNRNDMDYAGAPAVSDMDHDGSPEIVVGRVIFNADGTTRGKGTKGRGSWGTALGIGEGSQSAIADLDLDGVEEVIVGNAFYTPDGDLIWSDERFNDGMVGVANFDDDPEGEVAAVTGGSLRVIDTDGSLIWGPKKLWCEVAGCDDEDPSAVPPPQTIEANILSVPAIDDIDDDGYPEIIVAGGSQVVAFNHDGSKLWENHDVQDFSGATGASVFDFDGDGKKEVVYIDETSVHAYEGATGVEVFRSDEHGSNTLFDYPVIADVDGDGSAEIVVTHAFFGKAVTVYGAGDGNWAPTRDMWNQHAYSINNINDDFSIPTTATMAFTEHNSWHAAQGLNPDEVFGKLDLQVGEVSVCELACGTGYLVVAAQPQNVASGLDVDAGVKMTVYVEIDGAWQAVDTAETADAIVGGYSGAALEFLIPADLASQASRIRVKVDDVGSGRGRFPECVEDDNAVEIAGPFCR